MNESFAFGWVPIGGVSVIMLEIATAHGTLYKWSQALILEEG